MMAPTPKKPSAVFMIDVCWAVDVEMSPMSASAPVLKMPIASPETPSSTAKNRERVTGGKQETGRGEQREADDYRGPATEPVRKLTRATGQPRAMPVIVAY